MLISGLFDYAERYHPKAEIVSRDADGGEHRYGYAEAAARARRLASALRAAGILPPPCLPRMTGEVPERLSFA
ncbi:MAG: hypothetical protein HYX38_21720 [Rhodospirillales bacterium]|nr:hypothetical protein [Rhodospirillales bacterium]